MKIDVPFTGGFYQTRSRPLSYQECVNWYPNRLTSGGLSPESIYPTSGLMAVIESLSGIGRGMHLVNGVLYVVSGQRLFRIDYAVLPSGDSFSAVDIGFIGGSKRVQMASDTDQLAIVVPDEYAYMYTVGGAITDLSSVPNFISPVCDVVQINSKFVFMQSGSNIIFHSELNDGLTYLALDQYIVVQYPKNVGLIVYRNTLYCFGDYVAVPFADQGQSEFAFRPIPGAVIDVGLASVGAKVLFRDSFVFVGSGENAERSIWLFSGRPQKISSEPIDFIIQNKSPFDVTNSYMMRHSQNGADFACLKMGDSCFVFDLSTSLWHERSSVIGGNKVNWRVTSIQQAYNRVFVLDSDLSSLGEITDSAFDEYGVRIHRVITTQPFTNSGKTTRVYAIEAYFDVGYEAGDVLTLEYSDDGGFTWSEPISRGLGAIGEYGRRVIFDRLGSFTNTRVLRFTYTGRNPASFNKLMAKV